MVTACNAIGCAFPTRREAAVWGAIGLFVGLVMTLAVVTAELGRSGALSALDGQHGAPLAQVGEQN